MQADEEVEQHGDTLEEAQDDIVYLQDSLEKEKRQLDRIKCRHEEAKNRRKILDQKLKRGDALKA